jgi:hypothetical protein
MSKIWNALRELQRLKSGRVPTDAPLDLHQPLVDRRSTKRFLANVPVMVYGYLTTDDPFHEQAEALSVNAGGGIITLSTEVSPGQPLLLVHELNLKEQKCTVVRQIFNGVHATGIVVRFPEPIPDFWRTSGP